MVVLVLQKDGQLDGMVTRLFIKLKRVFMKKLTKEDAAKLLLRKGTSSPVRTAVVQMQVGEILLIEKADWSQRNGPGQMCSRITKRTGQEYKLNAVADGSGWVVERKLL